MSQLKEQLPSEFGLHEIETADQLSQQYFGALQGVASNYDLPTFSINKDIEKRLEKIEKRIHPISGDRTRLVQIPLEFRDDTDPSLPNAAAFYAELIQPLLLQGKVNKSGTEVAQRPDDEAMRDIIERLRGKGPDAILYYSLSKTPSPARTGSPDTLIDFAEIEMLKHYSLITRVAKDLGLNMRFTILDESDIMPQNENMGITGMDQAINKSLTKRVLSHFGASDLVAVKSLTDSIFPLLGEIAPELYSQKLLEHSSSIFQSINEGQQDNPAIIRIFTILECMPDQGLYDLGLNDEQIKTMRSLPRGTNPTALDPKLLDYLLFMTAGVNATMDLRSAAKSEAEWSNSLHEFPEYDDNVRLYSGVTRSASRIGFKTHETLYKGQTRNPMHGLAIYQPAEQKGERRKYGGVVPFNVMQRMQEDGELDIIALGDKPVLGLLQ